MTVDPGYFRERYAVSPDPYGLADRWYEARKYALTVALLPRQRYGAAFEPGCSIGVLTARLAPRCASLLACDAIDSAVASARTRTARLPGVRVERRMIPRDWPPGEFDLIVFSEILYYFDDGDLDQVSASAPARCDRTGTCSRCTGGIPRPIIPAPATRRTRRWPGIPGWPGWPDTGS